jgi:hypothetical protein
MSPTAEIVPFKPSVARFPTSYGCRTSAHGSSIPLGIALPSSAMALAATSLPVSVRFRRTYSSSSFGVSEENFSLPFLVR